MAIEKRWCICNLVGDGTSDNAFRPSICDITDAKGEQVFHGSCTYTAYDDSKGVYAKPTVLVLARADSRQWALAEADSTVDILFEKSEGTTELEASAKKSELVEITTRRELPITQRANKTLSECVDEVGKTMDANFREEAYT